MARARAECWLSRSVPASARPTLQTRRSYSSPGPRLTYIKSSPFERSNVGTRRSRFVSVLSLESNPWSRSATANILMALAASSDTYTTPSRSGVASRGEALWGRGHPECEGAGKPPC